MKDQLEKLIDEGKISDARKILVNQLKQFPSDDFCRSLLVQILIINAEWDKALNHLAILEDQESNSISGKKILSGLIHAEKKRHTIFTNQKTYPDFFPAPPSYSHELLNLKDDLLSKNIANVDNAISNLNDKLPIITGSLNGKTFKQFKNSDSLLSHVFEIVAYDRYLWISVDHIKELSIDEPKSLIDLVWIPGKMITTNNITLNCYFPVLYHGSSKHENDLVKMGRMTDFTSIGNAIQCIGHNNFEIDDKEYGLLELKSVLFTKQ